MVKESEAEELLDQGVVSLNPCLVGRWSRRMKKAAQYVTDINVLILVWLEDGQGVCVRQIGKELLRRLNPCLVGRWSRRAIKAGKSDLGMES